MKFSYQFSNLLGTVYRKGNLCFTPDGNTLISPVGNRITFYDLKSNKTSTLPIESKFNYTALDISPNGCLLLAIDENGEAHLISLVSNSIIHKYRFNRQVNCVRFSPDGKHIAATKGDCAFVFRTPSADSVEFSPFEMERVLKGAYDDTVHIEWSDDSNIVAVAAKDTTTRLYALKRFQNLSVHSIGGHTDALVASFFERDSLDLISVSRNGHVCVWDCSISPDKLVPSIEPPKKISRPRQESESEEDDLPDPEDRPDMVMENGENTSSEMQKVLYKRAARHFFLDLLREHRGVELTAATYHKRTKILITAFSCGSFFLHEMPEANMIHSLSMSDQRISSVYVNSTGDWLALACEDKGQLLVWEWQSETYILKQQGHFNNATCLCFSPDGQHIATGSLDGKVKLWNTSTGFCFVTFSEHSADITGVQYSANGKVVISSSLDGTVRAFDTTRYRNFRTFTSPRPVQFSCVALDSSGEFIAAGGQDVFDVFLWSLKFGRLLEVLSAHEGPVSSISFSPSSGSTSLASVSWDKTLRVWNAIESGAEHETIHLTADGLSVTFRPDGKEVAVSTLDGQISFFDVRTSEQVGSIEGRNDLGSGRSETDLITAKKSLQGKAFTTLCYTADGECLLAGGQSKNVCVYQVGHGILLNKFEITQNRSLDAVDDFVNRRKMTEFGNLALVEGRGEDSVTINLPGVRKGDMAARAFKPEVRVTCLRFSPTGREWAGCTTEGLLLYSLDSKVLFDPFLLDPDVTLDTTRLALKNKDYTKAVMMALRLNEHKFLQEILEAIPYASIEHVTRALPLNYAERLLLPLSAAIDNSTRFELLLSWAVHLLQHHALELRKRGPAVKPHLSALEKSLQQQYDPLAKLCEFNLYSLDYLSALGPLYQLQKIKKEEEEEDSDEEMLIRLS